MKQKPQQIFHLRKKLVELVPNADVVRKYIDSDLEYHLYHVFAGHLDYKLQGCLDYNLESAIYREFDDVNSK